MRIALRRLFCKVASGGFVGLPENIVMFNGDPVTFNGDYVIVTPA